MLFLIALILAAGFSVFCGNLLKKKPFIFYGAGVVITIVTVILSQEHFSSEIVNNYVLGLFTRGAFATALWAVVMWTGAFPNGSAPIKKLMPIRGELSILAAILTLGHNIGFGRTYFVRLFTDSDRMSSQQITASILTIAMLLIMIPLTIMSFKSVRKKMNAKTWKRIQRLAYLFYGMIYIHVLVLTYQLAQAGREGYWFSILVYSIVFIGYAVCRIAKAVLKKYDNKKAVYIAAAVLGIIGVSAVSVPAWGEVVERNPVPVVMNVAEESSSAEPTTVEENTVTTTAVTSGKNSKKTSSSTTTSASSKETKESSDTSSAKVTVTTVAEDESMAETEASETKTEQKTTDKPVTTVQNQDSPAKTEAPAKTQAPVQNKTDAPVKTTTAPVKTEPPATEPPQTEPPQTEPPQPQYIYNDGTYSGSSFGYDGNVYVTITIQNDAIVSISGSTEESDTWYFDSASGYVFGQIQSSGSAYVNAFSGATYSSNAIMNAVSNALNSARR